MGLLPDHCSHKQVLFMILLPPGRAIWPLLFSCLCVTSAAAADISVSATVGQDVLLASYYEIRPAGCLALQAPRVRITAPPALGRVTVVHIQQQPVQAGRCATVAAPVAQVRYRASRAGADTLAWEVRYQTRGPAPEQVSAELRALPARPAR